MPIPAVRSPACWGGDLAAALRGRDFLSVRDVTAVELLATLDLAFEMKADAVKYRSALKRRSLAMIFEKPSLRTRVSFEVGMAQLGGHALYLAPQDIRLGTRESIDDVAKTLERMVDAIMVRTFAHAVVEHLAAAAGVPVINGLTDSSHPCQALADYMTVVELKGSFAGVRLAYVGDGNNVATSLVEGAARVGVPIAVASPAGYEVPREVVAWCAAHAEPGFACRLTTDPFDAVADADVVYTDVWTSMGQEAEAEARRRVFAPYQVNAALFARARPDALFMHCLPAHRGEEVTDEVLRSPRSVVFQQAENRLHTEKALLYALMR